MPEFRLHILRAVTIFATAAASLMVAAPTARAAEDAVFLGWSQTEPGSKPILERLLADFKANHPGVNLEVIGVPNGQMETTLVLRRRSRQPVSVAQMQERWQQTYATLGGITDPNEVLGRDFLVNTFYPSALVIGQVRGQQLGVPWVFGTTGMVAHGKVLEDAGVTALPKTIDEFVAALRAIKRAKPASSPFGFTTKDNSLAQVETQIVFWQFGARFFDDDGNVAVDSPAARRALGFLADLVKEGLILPGNDRFDVRRLYSQELVGFYLDPPVARAFARSQSTIGGAVDRYVLPIEMPVLRPGDKPVAQEWAHLLVMYEQGGVKPAPDRAAAQLVRFLTRPDNQVAYFREAGVFPSNKEALVQLKDDAFLTRWLEVIANSQVMPDEPSKFSNSADLRRIIGEEVIAAMLGQKSADAGIEAMASRLKAARPRR